MKNLILTLVIILSSFSCYSDKQDSQKVAKQSVELKVKEEAKQGAQQQDINPFFWKITSNKATVYMLGSVHIGKPEWYPLPAKIEKAFKESQVLVTENDFREQNKPEIIQLSFYPDGKTVEDFLKPETLKKYKAELDELSIPFDQIKRFKAWTASFQIQYTHFMQKGYSPLAGIDMHFHQRAMSTNEKKEIQGLESVKDIYDLFDSFSNEEIDNMVLEFLKGTDNVDKDLKLLIDTWKSGNLEKMDKYLQTYFKEYPQLVPIFEKLLYDRNEKMVKKIVEYLKTDQTYFVIIGAGHFPGQRGIIQMLNDKGFKSEKM